MSSKRNLLLCCVFALCTGPASVWAGQCNDGVDNDGDGKVDAYVEAASGGSWTRAFVYQPNEIVDAVNVRLRQWGLPPFIKPSGHGYAFYFDNLTSSYVCQLLGYKTVRSMDCKYPEKHSSTGYRCTWYNGGDVVFRWTGSSWVTHPAKFWTLKSAPPWIASITCADPAPACSDLTDNDGDGLVDYPADAGCKNGNDLSELPDDPNCTDPNDPSESAQCSNGTDDDSDGLIDAADPGCWNDMQNPATYNPQLDNEARGTSQCQDTVDNDGDGKIDFPADPGCESRQDHNEYNALQACNNGVDDDRDGLTDYPADPGCSAPTDESERDPNGPQCDNGKDDDTDGKADYPDDGGCTGPTDNDERDPVSGVCNDGLDNDVDGYIDYSDLGCSASGGTSECHSSLSACDNCSDDDADGKADMRDACCTVPWGASENSCDTPTQHQCNDNADNDHDGYIDYQDLGCVVSGGTSECHSSLTQCDNCTDDDADGKIDMADAECTAPWGKSEGGSSGSTVCTDRADNDNDGYADDADEGCCASGEKSECHISLTQCDNCIDDDNDGLVDMQDAGCRVPWDISETCSETPATAARCYADQGADNSDVVENMKSAAAQMLKQTEPGSGLAALSMPTRAGRLAKQAETAAENARAAVDCAVIAKTVSTYNAKMGALYKTVVNAKAGLKGKAYKQALQNARRLRERAAGFSAMLLNDNGCK